MYHEIAGFREWNGIYMSVVLGVVLLNQCIVLGASKGTKVTLS